MADGRDKLWDEFPAIALGLLNLVQTRRGGHAGIVSTGAVTGAGFGKTIGDLLVRLVNEMGWGVRDEGQFPMKVGQLPDRERSVIEKLIDEHESGLIDRLRLITVNVPSPPAKTVKTRGRKEKRDKNGEILEEGTPDKEETVPSSIDGGVEFLKSVAHMVEGKNKEEQIRILQKLNIHEETQGKYAEATKHLAKRFAQALGFDTSKEISLEQIVKRLIDGEPRKPVPMGWWKRFINVFIIGSKPIPEQRCKSGALHPNERIDPKF